MDFLQQRRGATEIVSVIKQWLLDRFTDERMRGHVNYSFDLIVFECASQRVAVH